jgi:O-antigen ligase/uncharacterized membrane protein YbhN (UPF0104 family)
MQAIAGTNSQKRFSGWRIVAILVMLTSVAYVLSLLDLSAVSKALCLLSASSLVLTFSSIAAVTLLSILRLRVILHDLSYPVAWGSTMRAVFFGGLASMILQFIGQTLTRAGVLRHAGVPAVVTLSTVLYEKAISVFLLSLFAVAAVLFLFGTSSMDISAGAWGFFKLFFGMVIVTMVTFYVAKVLPEGRVVYALMRISVITLMMQIMMVGAYVLVAQTLSPHLSLMALIAASALVMFAAALPLSMGGWGIRELSAVYVYGMIGMPPEHAVLVAVIVGAFSQIVLLTGAAFATTQKDTRLPDRVLAGALDHWNILARMIPLMVAVFVFFQLNILFFGHKIIVSLADPLALLGACISLALWWRRGWEHPRWRVPSFENMFMALTVLLLFGFLWGWVSVGWSYWAFLNRLLGWGVLLGYVLTGALIVRQLGLDGLSILSRTFVIAACSVVGTMFLFHCFTTLETGSFVFHWIRMEGFSGNANAFAFQMLMAVAVVLALRQTEKRLERNGLITIVVLIILVIGVWASVSRAVLIALPMVVGMGTLMVAKQCTKAVMVTAVLLAGIMVMPMLLVPFKVTEAPGAATWEALTFAFTHTDHVALLDNSRKEEIEHRDAWRLSSYMSALDLWKGSPVFGIGLGSYHKHYALSSQDGHMIHSIPLWILVEFGFVGVLVFGVVFFRLMQSLWIHRESRGARLAFLIMVVMVAEGLFHDLFFQRSFWLLLGAGMALPIERRVEAGDRRMRATHVF